MFPQTIVAANFHEAWNQIISTPLSESYKRLELCTLLGRGVNYWNHQFESILAFTQ